MIVNTLTFTLAPYIAPGHLGGLSLEGIVPS